MLSTTLSKEVRATDPVTGAQKGRKPQRLGLIPWGSVLEISEVFDYGSRKYSEHNWRKGYTWSWSFDALLRHLTAWWGGEDKDPESGLSHLAHAGFHVLALMWFKANAKGVDDRWREEAQNAPATPAQPQVSLSSPASISYPVDGNGSVVDEEVGFAGVGGIGSPSYNAVFWRRPGTENRRS